MTTGATGRASSKSGLPSIAEQRRWWDQRFDERRIPNDWQLRRGAAVLEIVRSLGFERPEIIDLGCGTGWFTAQLARVGHATGIDLSETAIALAKEQFPDISFLVANVFETRLPAEHYDVVVSQEVIAHVEDQVTYLDVVARILKPRGYLVVTTANKLVMARWDWDPTPEGHIKLWLNMRGLKRLLERQFDVLRTTTLIPLGNRGFLRLINSYKLNAALGWLIPRAHLDRLKEWAGLGYTLIALARKRV